MPATVRAGQGHRDVVVTPALLHLEIGAADRFRPGIFLQARELEEVPEKVPMGTDSQVPFAHRFKCHHLLDVVRVEVLQLKPRMNRLAGTEKPRSWKATNDTMNPFEE
jgi:hypothetical protein